MVAWTSVWVIMSCSSSRSVSVVGVYVYGWGRVLGASGLVWECSRRRSVESVGVRWVGSTVVIVGRGMVVGAIVEVTPVVALVSTTF